MDLEDNKYVGQVSTFMRLLTSKENDLSSYFDKNGESVLNNDNPLQKFKLTIMLWRRIKVKLKAI